jgi:succinate dehydrogenase / fumarate reductase, cytochrome b subunit
VTPAQLAFLAGLVLVLSSVSAYSVLVVATAARRGRTLGVGPFGRSLDHSPLGRAAFLTHRVTGFGVFAFLCLHVLDVSLYGFSPRLYDEVHALYGMAPMRLFECGLLFAILFHATNGIRLLAVDLVPLSARWSRRLLHVVVVVSGAGSVAGSALILAPLFR